MKTERHSQQKRVLCDVTAELQLFFFLIAQRANWEDRPCHIAEIFCHLEFKKKERETLQVVAQVWPRHILKGCTSLAEQAG